MKIQCNVCEAAEATVLCCADEAALCWECDDKVHAANKLASKHQRVPLSSSSSQMPKCDICQETSGLFFCLQDRALLCRKCDVAIHTANTLVSAHQRFLLTGVKVGLESADPGVSSSSVKSLSGENISDTKTHSLSRRGTPMPLADEYNEVLPPNPGGVGDFAATKVSFAGGSAAGSIPSWHSDEFLGLPEFNQNYGFMDAGSSKVCLVTIKFIFDSIYAGVDEDYMGCRFNYVYFLMNANRCLYWSDICYVVRSLPLRVIESLAEPELATWPDVDIPC
nr:BBX transcription factor [Toona sinensis]